MSMDEASIRDFCYLRRPLFFISLRMASSGAWGIAWVARKAVTASLIIWKFSSVPALSGT